jgi:hypothetical protein
MPPQLEAHRLCSQFSKQPIAKIWISISNFPGTFKPNCAYLRTFALYLRLFSKKEVGFQSEALFWEDLFGERTACR